MSFISTCAKLNIPPERIGISRPIIRRNKSWWDDPERETSFGGHGCLTKEQYERGMALSRKMAKMSAW